MKLTVKKRKTGATEAFIDSLLVGYFEQMDPQTDIYSFMLKCSHDKLTGDHYILIGKHLNSLNNTKKQT